MKLFISVMRGTPLMLQLMVVYYGPFLLFDFTPPGNWRFGAVIVGFVINYAAYFAEIYRAGYESIPVGQFEAAQVLGYTGGQTFGRILLPQMIRRVLPPVTERGHHAREGHLARLRHRHGRDVHPRQADRRLAQHARYAGARGGGTLYYVFNYIVAFCDGARGALARLLPVREGPDMNVLTMQDVRKSFGSLEVLKGISLTVGEGEAVSVIGPSGSGKSTLLRCATRLKRWTAARSPTGTTSPRRWTRRERASMRTRLRCGGSKSRFGLVFQQFNLFPHYTVLKKRDGCAAHRAEARARRGA